MGTRHVCPEFAHTFSLPEDIRQGAFHPLRELEETEAEVEELDERLRAA
jgi:hypothetical protein